ncbi:tegument protein pp150 [Proboscivirus elephantidbeta5]|uniref:Tegument protein pp150 n=1 Tax=Elephant endotheliotropic herpesvirus 5 TaxID=768738 RepID=A0A075CYF0_9BETA|nr:tegument protein pp150 [Elephant endotheliotropic herpesvirus 5]AHC02830.1 tegument protein pp150 [Elephant endotheliotropic herpesvirus 5]
MGTERSPYIGVDPVKECIIQSFLNDVSLGNLIHIPVTVFEATASQSVPNANTKTIFSQFNICVFRLQYCERLKNLVPINPELEKKIEDEFRDFKEDMEQQRLKGPLELIFRNVKAHAEYKRKKHFFDPSFFNFVNQELYNLVHELKWKKPPSKRDRNDIVNLNLINMPPILLEKVRKQFDEVSNQMYDFNLINVKDVNWENGPTVTHFNRICYFTRLYHIISGKHTAFVDKMEDELLGNMELLSTCIYGFDILPVGHFIQRYLYKNLAPRLQQSRVSDTQSLPVEYIRKTLVTFHNEGPLLFQFIRKYLYDNRNANAERLDFLGRLQRMQQEAVKEESDKHRVCAKYADIAALERMISDLDDTAADAVIDDIPVTLNNHLSVDRLGSRVRDPSPNTADSELLRALERVSLVTPEQTGGVTTPHDTQPLNVQTILSPSVTQTPSGGNGLSCLTTVNSASNSVLTDQQQHATPPVTVPVSSQSSSSHTANIQPLTPPSSRQQAPPPRSRGSTRRYGLTETERLDLLLGAPPIDLKIPNNTITAGCQFVLQQPLFMPYDELIGHETPTPSQPSIINGVTETSQSGLLVPLVTQTRDQHTTTQNNRSRKQTSSQPKQSILRRNGIGNNTQPTRSGKQTFRLKSPIFRSSSNVSSATTNNIEQQSREHVTQNVYTQMNTDELSRIETTERIDEVPSVNKPYSPPPWVRRPYKPPDTYDGPSSTSLSDSISTHGPNKTPSTQRNDSNNTLSTSTRYRSNLFDENGGDFLEPPLPLQDTEDKKSFLYFPAPDDNKRIANIVKQMKLGTRLLEEYRQEQLTNKTNTEEQNMTSQPEEQHVNLFLPESHNINRPVTNPFDPNFVANPPQGSIQHPRSSTQQQPPPPFPTTQRQLPQRPQPSPKPRSRGFRDYRRGGSILSGGRVYHTDGSSTTDDSSDNSWSDESRRSRRKPGSRSTAATRSSRPFSADDGSNRNRITTARKSPHSTAAPSGANTSKQQSTDISELSGMGSLSLGSPVQKNKTRSSSLQARTPSESSDRFLSRDVSSSSIDVLSRSESMNSRMSMSDMLQSGPSSLPATNHTGASDETQQVPVSVSTNASDLSSRNSTVKQPKFFMRDAQKMFRMVNGKPKLPPMKSSWFSSGDEEGLECLRQPSQLSRRPSIGGQDKKISVNMKSVLSGKSASQQARECLDNVMNHTGDSGRYALKGQSAAPAGGISSYVPVVKPGGTTYYTVQRRSSSQDRATARPRPRQTDGPVANLVDVLSTTQTNKTLVRSNSLSNIRVGALSRQGSNNNVFAPQQRPSIVSNVQQPTVAPKPIFTASSGSKPQLSLTTTTVTDSTNIQTHPTSTAVSTESSTSSDVRTSSKQSILQPSSFTRTGSSETTKSSSDTVDKPPISDVQSSQHPDPVDGDPLRHLISELDGTSITGSQARKEQATVNTKTSETQSQSDVSSITKTVVNKPTSSGTTPQGKASGGTSASKPKPTSQEKKVSSKKSSTITVDKTRKSLSSSVQETKSKGVTSAKQTSKSSDVKTSTKSDVATGQLSGSGTQILNANLVTIDGSNIRIAEKASVFAPNVSQTSISQIQEPPRPPPLPKPSTQQQLSATQTTNIFSAPISATCPVPISTSQSSVVSQAGLQHVLPGAEHIFLSPVDDEPPQNQRVVTVQPPSASALQNVLPGAEHIFLPPQDTTEPVVHQQVPSSCSIFAQQLATHSTEELRALTEELRQQVQTVQENESPMDMQHSSLFHEIVEAVMASDSSAAPTPSMELGSTPTNFMDTS